MIRCITLDWGDTLAVNHGMPYQATQRLTFTDLGRALAKAGCAVPDDFLARWMGELAVVWKSTMDVQANPDHREFDFNGMIAGWVDATLTPSADRTAVHAAIDRCKDRMCDTVIPYSESLPTLAKLKAKGIRLGILSHVPWPGDGCRRWFARHGLAEHLDFYSLSCEIGWIKPNPIHFSHARELAGVEPHEILHVGDHPFRDVEGARRAGFRTCLRLTEGIYGEEALAVANADLTILHLAELVDAVETL